MKHLAMKSLFSFQPSGLSFSAWRKWVMASGRLAEGGEANRVEAIFLSIHDNCNDSPHQCQTSQAICTGDFSIISVMHCITNTNVTFHNKEGGSAVIFCVILMLYVNVQCQC